MIAPYSPTDPCLSNIELHNTFATETATFKCSSMEDGTGNDLFSCQSLNASEINSIYSEVDSWNNSDLDSHTVSTNSECSKIPHSPLSESIFEPEPDFVSICSNTTIPDYVLSPLNITYSSDIPCCSIQSPDATSDCVFFSKSSTSYSKNKLKDDDTIFVSKPRDPRAKILYLSKLELKCKSASVQIIKQNQYPTEVQPKDLKSNKNKINNDKLRSNEHFNDNNRNKDGIIYEQVKLKCYLDFITDVSTMPVKNSDVHKNSGKNEPKTFGSLSDTERLSISDSNSQGDRANRAISDDSSSDEYKKDNILPVVENCSTVTTMNYDSDNGKKCDSLSNTKCNGKGKSNKRESGDCNEKEDGVIYLINNLEERKKIRRKYKVKRFLKSLSQRPDKTNLFSQSLEPQLKTTHQTNTESNYLKNNVSYEVKNIEFDDGLRATHFASVSETSHNIEEPFNSPKIKNPYIRFDFSKFLHNSISTSREKCFGEINKTFESNSNKDFISKTSRTTSTSTKQYFDEMCEPESSEPSSLKNDTQLSTMQQLAENVYVSGLLSVTENKPAFCGDKIEEKDLKSVRSTNFTIPNENELVTFSEEQYPNKNSDHPEYLDENDKKSISNTNHMKNDTLSIENSIVPLSIQKEFCEIQLSEKSDVQQQCSDTKIDERICSTITDEKEVSTVNNLKNNMNSSIMNSESPSEETNDYHESIMSSYKQVQDPDLSEKKENLESIYPNLIEQTEVTSCNNSDAYFTILTKEKSEKLKQLKESLSIIDEDLLSHDAKKRLPGGLAINKYNQTVNETLFKDFSFTYSALFNEEIKFPTDLVTEKYHQTQSKKLNKDYLAFKDSKSSKEEDTFIDDLSSEKCHSTKVNKHLSFQDSTFYNEDQKHPGDMITRKYHQTEMGKLPKDFSTLSKSNIKKQLKRPNSDDKLHVSGEINKELDEIKDPRLLNKQYGIRHKDTSEKISFIRVEDTNENCLTKDNTSWEKSLALNDPDFYVHQEMKRLESCEGCSTAKSFFSSLRYPVNENDFESKNSSVSEDLLPSTDLNRENHHFFKRRKTSVDSSPYEEIYEEEKYQNKYFKVWTDQANLDEQDIEKDVEIASSDAAMDLPESNTKSDFIYSNGPCYKNDEISENIPVSLQGYLESDAEKAMSDQLVLNETLIDLQLTDLPASDKATERAEFQRVDKRKNENNLDELGNIKRNKKSHSSDKNNKINEDTFLENYLLRGPSWLNTVNKETDKEQKIDNGSDIEINDVRERCQESESYELINLASPGQDSDVQIEEIHLSETEQDVLIIKEILPSHQNANLHKERSEQENVTNDHTENYGEITGDKKDNDSFNQRNSNEENNSAIDNRISLVFDENEIQNEQRCADKLKAVNPEKRKILLKALQIVQMQEISPLDDYEKKIENGEELKTNQAIEIFSINITDSNNEINDSIKEDYSPSAEEVSLSQSSVIVENSDSSNLSKDNAFKQSIFKELFCYNEDSSSYSSHALKSLKSPKKTKTTKFNNLLSNVNLSSGGKQEGIPIRDSSSCDSDYPETDEEKQKLKRSSNVKYYSNRIRNLKHRNKLKTPLKVIKNANAKTKGLRSVKKRKLTATTDNDASASLKRKHGGVSCRSSLSSDNNKTHRKDQKTKEKLGAKFNGKILNNSKILVNSGSMKINQSSLNNAASSRRYKRIRPYRTANKIYSSPPIPRVSLEAKHDNIAKRNLFSNDNGKKYTKVETSKAKDSTGTNRKKGNDNLKALTKSGGLIGKGKHNISKVIVLRKNCNKNLTKEPKLYTLPATTSLEAQNESTSKRSLCTSYQEKSKRDEKPKPKENAKVYCKNKDDSRQLIKYSVLTTESNIKENIPNTLRKSLKSKRTKSVDYVSLPPRVSAASKAQHEITTKGDLFLCHCGEKFQRIKLSTTENNANVYFAGKDSHHITKEITINNTTSPRKYVKGQISKKTKLDTSPPKVSIVTNMQHKNTPERNLVSGEKEGMLKATGNKISVTMKSKKDEKFKPDPKHHNKSGLTDHIKNNTLIKNSKICDTIEYKKDKMSKSILDPKLYSEKGLTNQTKISVLTKKSKDNNTVKYKKTEKSKSKLDEKLHSHKGLTDQIKISALNKKTKNSDVVKDEKSKSKLNAKFHTDKILTNQLKIRDLTKKSKICFTMTDTKNEKSKLKLRAKLHNEKSLTHQTKINALAKKNTNNKIVKDKISNIDAKLYSKKGLRDHSRKSCPVDKRKTSDAKAENSKFYNEKGLIEQKELIVLLNRVDQTRTCDLSKENTTSSNMKYEKVEKIKTISKPCKGLADQTTFRSFIKEGKTSDTVVHKSETSKDDVKLYSKNSLTNKTKTNSFPKETKTSDTDATFLTRNSKEFFLKKLELDPLPRKASLPSKLQDDDVSQKDLLSHQYKDVSDDQKWHKINHTTNPYFNNKIYFQNKERRGDLRKKSPPHKNIDSSNSMPHFEIKTTNFRTKIKSCSQSTELNSPSGSEQSEQLSEKDSCESYISAAENKDTESLNSPIETRKTCCTHPHVNSNFAFPLNFIRN